MPLSETLLLCDYHFATWLGVCQHCYDSSVISPIPLRLLLAASVWLAVGARAAGELGPRNEPVDVSRYTAVYYLDAQRGDDFKGNGSREHPWASLMTALEAAGTPTAAQRVALLVSQGRYAQPTFVLKPHVDLFGGFASPGGVRDVYAHATLLDGEDTFRIAIGANDARVDGFQFVRGRVQGKGAALLCDGTSPMIANCVFTRNRTLSPADWNPPLLHERADDGGAVMCLNSAAPVFEHCYFFDNATECGRGGALACDRQSSPRITGCVFANNRAGLDDPMRSSDGGAVSIFDESRPEFVGNVVVANQSLNRNDAGGIFVALWSSPKIADNVIVGNEGGDDAGGLFIGGQEHRYDAPFDAFPPAEKFNVVVERNVFVGNANAWTNSGALRVTMEARVRLAHNVIAANQGGLALERSEITADRNTVWQDWRFLEDQKMPGPSRFNGNVLKGPAGAIATNVILSGNMIEVPVAGSDNVAVTDIFEDDGVEGGITNVRFDAATMTTQVVTARPLPAGDYAGRAVWISNGKRHGQWRVIQAASASSFVFWGRLRAVTTPLTHFEILRTFRLRKDAPAGLGAVLNKP